MTLNFDQLQELRKLLEPFTKVMDIYKEQIEAEDISQDPQHILLLHLEVQHAQGLKKLYEKVMKELGLSEQQTIIIPR